MPNEPTILQRSGKRHSVKEEESAAIRPLVFESGQREITGHAVSDEIGSAGDHSSAVRIAGGLAPKKLLRTGREL